MDHFSDPAAVERYITATPQRVPGYADLHRMALVLLSEKVPDNACVLVLGAGGGLELLAFAEARPNWSFVGVDPSQPMLDLAADVLGPRRSQVELMKGVVTDAPSWPFEGATCLLTLHFLSVPERLHVLRELKSRLKPGAPLIIAHHCKSDAGAAEDWLARSVAFSIDTASDTHTVVASAANMAKQLTLLTVTEEEALLIEAGFRDPALFYAGFSFRGWVAWANKD
ncbi:class I SAM-dependent methyltransferase [Celeribacter sp.]|uniref:class I SAM-dependent methyltransferase n=1 Tax=Celeribacter sp. TaxID=1890673 RepID=UPI003A910D3A